ncbi:MAG: MBL fold metallo-hydrolase [Proteobacteria bacterium]|nr:MBL fold metallo-hydrolase [Pseudomonadota bacterium]
MNRYGDVYELELGNTKVFLINGGKKILVDTGLIPLSQEVIDFFEKNGMKMGDDKEKEVFRKGSYPYIVDFLNDQGIKLEMIVCTHCHLDHVGSLSRLKSFYHVPVALHTLDIPIVEGREKLPTPSFVPPHLLKFFEFEPCTVDHALEDGECIAGDLRVIHIPGHTRGNIALLYRDEVLISGDSLSGKNELNPEIAPDDLNPPSPMASLNHKEALESLKRLLAYSFKIILPSHGKSVTEDGKERLRRVIEGMA